MEEWFKHLKEGIKLALAGHVITWGWLLLLTIALLRKGDI